jgi:hypothetical protein
MSVTVTLVIVSSLAVSGITLLATVIFGIHADERRMSLRQMPRTRAALITRRILGVYSTPGNQLRK